MDLTKTYGTDRNLENEGAWIDLGDGAKVKIARLTNRSFREYLDKKRRTHRHAIEVGGQAAEDLATRFATQGLARYVLLGWEGFAVDGVDLEYTIQNAERVLDEFPDFRAQVMAIAADRANFRAQEVAEAGKN